MISRHNILDLLGQNSKKYHSCIITCYSFDFIYFEQRVLPKLRQAGITNVNIYVDAYQFDRQMQQYIDCGLLNSKTTYSITPIRMSCAFHPKIILAIGNSKGFLALGSGNITSSGLSSNEEIWSAFHITEDENLTEPIFQSVAAYLQSFESYVKGTNRVKLKWVRDNSPWYNTISDNAQLNQTLDLKHEGIKVLYTYEKESIFDELSERLPLYPKCIKIVSPYYNSNGRLLQKIIKRFEPKKIHCVVDPLYGSMPYKMEPEPIIEFSDWSTLKKESNYQHNRLHAKAFQFEYESETFFLFGSANATIEAFGTSGKESHSAEASILLHAKQARNYLHELGIHIPKKGTFKIPPEETIINNDIDRERQNFAVFIQHSELELKSLTFNIEKTFSTSCKVEIEDPDGQLIVEKELDGLQLTNCFELPENCSARPFRLAIYILDERVSNFSLIHNQRELLYTNPDSRVANLNALFNTNFFGDLELEELLDFITVRNDVFDRSYQAPRKPSLQEEEHQANVKSIPEDEFNKNASIVQTDESYENYIISRTEEFLNSLNFANEEFEDITDSVEQLAMDAPPEGLDDNQTVSGYKRPLMSSNEGRRIAHKIAMTLKKITNALWEKKCFHIDNNLFSQDASLATFYHLNALLIGFHLILKKRTDFYSENRHHVTIQFHDGKEVQPLEYKFGLLRSTSQAGNMKNEISYTVDEANLPGLRSEIQLNTMIVTKQIDHTASISTNHSFLPSLIWPKDYFYQGISDYIINGLGSFLLLLTKDKLNRPEEIARWDEKKGRLLTMSIITLMHCRWPDKTKDTKHLLLLNIFHLLDTFPHSEALSSELLKSIEKLKHSEFLSVDDIQEIINFHIKYKMWLNIYRENPKNLKRTVTNRDINCIIFSKTYGFSKLKWCYAKTVNLETPLGKYDEERELFGFSDVFIGTLPIFYS